MGLGNAECRTPNAECRTSAFVLRRSHFAGVFVAINLEIEA